MYSEAIQSIYYIEYIIDSKIYSHFRRIVHLSKQDTIFDCYLWRKQSRQAGGAVDIRRDLGAEYIYHIKLNLTADLCNAVIVTQ